MGIASASCVTGTVEGTGAAIDINLGFVPTWVRVFNYDGGPVVLEWFQGMTDAHAMKFLGTPTITLLTSLGISELDDGVSTGFTIGADTDLNVADETMFYIACRD